MRDLHRPNLTPLANEIRRFIKGQNWRPFLRYSNRVSLMESGYFCVLDEVLNICICRASIRCRDGEIVVENKGRLMPAPDAEVVHMYTSWRMQHFGADAELMFDYMQDWLGS
jgi:hypothetical protein